MAITTDLAEIAYLAWLTEEEKTRQKYVQLARDYYAGDQYTELSERQKEYLGHKITNGRFVINYCKMVVNAIAERMIVTGFDSTDKGLSKWAWDLWTNNRMDATQMDVHQNAVRDGEYFVLVSPTEQNGIRFVAHPRYTDPVVGGDGYGCKAFYEQDDPTNPMENATKRWTERISDGAKMRTYQRMNVYFPDRIEKYVADAAGGWVEFFEADQPWPVPWVDSGGDPLGIPIVPFFNAERITELWDAIPIQDAINKSAIDLVAAADAAGFPLRVTPGFYFTTDGKAPESDGGNYVELTPGAFIFVPDGKTVEELDIPDLRPLLEGLDNWVIRLGQVTDTPLSRFQLTGQVKSSQTLKQEESPLLSKVRERQVRFGNSWEDCFKVAARLENAFGSEKPSTENTLSTLWEPAETRDEKEHIETIGLKVEKLKIPIEQAWREVGYSQEEIEKMFESEEYLARQAMAQNALAMMGQQQTEDDG